MKTKERSSTQIFSDAFLCAFEIQTPKIGSDGFYTYLNALYKTTREFFDETARMLEVITLNNEPFKNFLAKTIGQGRWRPPQHWSLILESIHDENVASSFYKKIDAYISLSAHYSDTLLQSNQLHFILMPNHMDSVRYDGDVREGCDHPVNIFELSLATQVKIFRMLFNLRHAETAIPYILQNKGMEKYIERLKEYDRKELKEILGDFASHKLLEHLLTTKVHS